MFILVIVSFSSCLGFYINWELWSIEHRYDKCYPDSTKMIGVWRSDDGAIIELKSENRCSVRNLKQYNYDWDLHRDTIAILNFEGYWSIKPDVQSDGKGVTVRGDTVYIDPSVSKWDTIGYNLCMHNATVNCEPFRIHNKKISGEITPISLYHFIGDPDEFDLYEFYQDKGE